MVTQVGTGADELIKHTQTFNYARQGSKRYDFRVADAPDEMLDNDGDG